MKLSEMQAGDKRYVALASTVLAVLSRRVDGYCVYVGSVCLAWFSSQRRDDG